MVFFWSISLLPLILAMELYRMWTMIPFAKFIFSLLLSFVLGGMVLVYFITVYTHASLVGTLLVFFSIYLLILSTYAFILRREAR
jgi:hypothetical protein